MKREYRDFARDILTETELSISFIQGMTFEDFKHDDKTSYAATIG